MQTQAGGEGRCGIGARLRAARERSGFTPVQAAERLHIDPQVISALETEAFESLGAPVYVRGHLKHYAELVGEPAAELQRQYAASVQAAALPDLTRIPKRAPARDRQALLAPGFIILGGIGLIGVVWWVLNIFEAEQAQVAAPADTSIETNAAPPAVPSSDAPAPPMESVTPPAAVPKPAARLAAGDPALEARREPAAGSSVAPGSVAPAPAAAPPVPRNAELTLRFSADSWVEVYDANGQRLFYDIGSADTTRTLRGAAPLRVVLGNAPGVTLEVNGRETAIPEAALRDGEARFVVNRSGRIVRSRVAAGSVP
ncbi:MAG TPA: RodZ domain-containing protein [Steroidobacteraceae bacterium]|nr:RodZ domain-containing protein [Steroidobacteraceae bacterium]